MIRKNKISSDQNTLSGWFGGKSETVGDIRRKEQEKDIELEKSLANIMNDSKRDFSSGFSSNDFSRSIMGILENITGSKILICPECKGDVVNHSEVFAKCPVCGMLYFKYELVNRKSFRMKMNSDTSTDLYASENSEFVRCNVDGVVFEEIPV
jgi:hypothetical protein